MSMQSISNLLVVGSVISVFATRPLLKSSWICTLSTRYPEQYSKIHRGISYTVRMCDFIHCGCAVTICMYHVHICSSLYCILCWCTYSMCFHISCNPLRGTHHVRVDMHIVMCTMHCPYLHVLHGYVSPMNGVWTSIVVHHSGSEKGTIHAIYAYHCYISYRKIESYFNVSQLQKEISLPMCFVSMLSITNFIL